MDEQLIRSELRSNNHNISKTARSLGLDFFELKQEFGVKLEPIVRPVSRRPTDISTLGKPGMQDWVIAVKANGDPWPTEFYNAISSARQKYMAGTHEMCQQKRHDGWVVLYLIPRKKPRERSTWFNFDWS